jgi:hypothetical protein
LYVNLFGLSESVEIKRFLAEKSIALQDELLATNIKLIFAQISMLQGAIIAMHKYINA